MSKTVAVIFTVTMMLLVKSATAAECSARNIDDPIILQGSAAMSLHRAIDEVAKDYEKLRGRVGHQVTINVRSTASSVDHFEYGANGDYQFSITDTNVGDVLKTDPVMAAIVQDALVLPTQAAFLDVCYNLPNLHGHLILNRRNIVRILTGDAKFWNDTELRDLNPHYNLGDEEIKPTVRKDDSGETFILTGALMGANVDVMWKSAFSSPNFTNGVCCKSQNWDYPGRYYFADGVIGVAGVVKSIPNTVVYINQEIAERNNLTCAGIDNGIGQITEPTDETMQRVMEYAFVMNQDPLFDLTAAAVVTKSYPFAARHFLIMPQMHFSGVDCCEIRETVGFIIHYMNAKVIGMVRAPEAVAEATFDLLKQITCDGLNSYQVYMASTVQNSQAMTITIVIIIASVAAASAMAAGIFLAVNSYRKVNKELDAYVLPSHEVKVTSGSASTHASTDAPEAEYQYNKVMLSEIDCPPPKRWGRRTKVLAVREHKRVNKANILPLFGYYQSGKNLYAVWEFPAKGSLRRAIGSAKFEIDLDIKAMLCLNLVDGVHYLHQYGIIHGNLSTISCYMDGGWTLKIGHWLDNAIYSIECPEALTAFQHATGDDDLEFDDVLKVYFKDPRTFNGTSDKKADLFSIGMLVHEIFSVEKNSEKAMLEDSARLNEQDIKEVVKYKLKTGQAQTRPTNKEIPNAAKVLVELCTGDMEYRPSPQFLIKELSKLRNRKSEIVDMLMEQMEGYTQQLEEKVEARTATLQEQSAQLESVTEKMQGILFEVLPEQVARLLIAGGRPEPEQFDSVTVLYSDVCGFTKISSTLLPSGVMQLLNELWLMFDDACSKHDAYKVDTIGDCYVVASGVPNRNGHLHAKEICDMSITLLDACRKSRIVALGGNAINVRVGINSGPAIAGVVGLKMPQYCVFGETVNYAALMESSSLPMQTQISNSTASLLQNYYDGQYNVEQRTDVAQGKPVFWLKPLDPNQSNAGGVG